MNFQTFKAGYPARSIFAKLGMSEVLEAATSWCSLERLVVDFNDRSSGGFVDRVVGLDGVASSGERVLLHAILFATDFAHVADALAGSGAWKRMGNVSGEWQRAVAACIERAES
jgi:hypothetical protein